MSLKENPIVQQNLTKFKLVRKSKRKDAPHYLVVDGFEYKLIDIDWKYNLHNGITKPGFDPMCLLTSKQVANHCINLINK